MFSTNVQIGFQFTSESHLHTMLNVLRFARDRTSVLSEQGVKILNGTNELCYLTQIVMRLFEDNRRDLCDPRRFRVEIMFSPGATATPLHMHEQDRDSDPSRFDTAPLEMIGRDGLTCQELEDFFHAAVMEGASKMESAAKIDAENEAAEVPIVVTTEAPPAFLEPDPGAFQASAVDIPSEVRFSPVKALSVLDDSSVIAEPVETEALTETSDLKGTNNTEAEPAAAASLPESSPEPKDEQNDDRGGEKDDPDETGSVRNMERKFFWSTVAVGSFVLAAGCLVLAMNLVDDPRRTRRYSTRRY
jgi:Histidine phosphatase superfamily (branch 2)